MTPKPSRYPLEKPRVSASIIAWRIEGQSEPQIVAHLNDLFGISVSLQAVDLFLKRHQDELDALKAKVAEAVHEVTIADKRDRLLGMHDRWMRLQSVIQARSLDRTWKDIPGHDTGLLAHTIKVAGNGDSFDEFAVDTGLLKAMLDLEHEAANQLGQLPKGDTNIFTGPNLIVREYHGYDPHAAG